MQESKHILSALVQNHPGILAKVAGLFSRRGFNIDSLAVGISERPGCSRMTIVVNGDDALVEQMVRQLDKLIDVIEIHVLQLAATVQRELVLIKVGCTLANRSEIIQIAEIFRAKIVDVSLTSLTMEITGPTGKLEALFNVLQPYALEKMVRTGIIALERDQADLEQAERG
jgi:acetolactate synthase I/III small subunit